MIEIDAFAKGIPVPADLQNGFLCQQPGFSAVGVLRVRDPRRKPQMTAQMIAGAELLFCRSQLLRRIEGAPEAAPNVLPVRLGVLVQPQLCPAHIQFRPHAAPRGAGRSRCQHIGVDDLRGQKFRHGRGPFPIEVQRAVLDRALPSNSPDLTKAFRMVSASAAPSSSPPQRKASDRFRSQGVITGGC